MLFYTSFLSFKIASYLCMLLQLPIFLFLLPCLNVSMIHIVGQLCDIFSLSFSLLSVWHLLNLSGVYWCNNWCLHSPTPPLLCGAPHAPTQWIHLHPDYRTNCHAGRKANQILRQQLGEEIAFPLSGRGASPSSLCLRFNWRERSKGWKGGKLLGCSWTARLRSSLTHFLPSSPSLSTSLPTHPDTTYQSLCNTRDYIPPSSPADETEQ